MAFRLMRLNWKGELEGGIWMEGCQDRDRHLTQIIYLDTKVIGCRDWPQDGGWYEKQHGHHPLQQRIA